MSDRNRKKYTEDGFNRVRDDFDEEELGDVVDRFLERRNQQNEEYDRLRQSIEERYIGDRSSRQNEAARRVIADGRVTQNPYARRQSYQQPQPREERSRSNTKSDNSHRNYIFGQPPQRSAEQRRQSGGEQPVKRFVKLALLIVVCLVALYYAVMSVAVSGVNRVKVDTSQSVSPAEETAHIAVRSSTPFVKNVLLLGIDDDGGAGCRSDTIMIASVDTLHNQVKLCSILRDNYVEIPGHKSSKINAAYAYGGAELTMQTIEKNYRLHLDDYVSVSMDALISVVDAVGGVDITITDAEAKQINRYAYSDNTAYAGDQHLDGKQAVCYARIRKIDSDFGRTSRQRTLINAIVAKCRTLSPGKLVGLVKTVSPYLTTNMSSAEIATLGLKVVPALGGEIQQLSLPLEGSYRDRTVNGMAVLDSDLSANTQALHEFLYGK